MQVVYGKFTCGWLSKGLARMIMTWAAVIGAEICSTRFSQCRYRTTAHVLVLCYCTNMHGALLSKTTHTTMPQTAHADDRSPPSHDRLPGSLRTSVLWTFPALPVSLPSLQSLLLTLPDPLWPPASGTASRHADLTTLGSAPSRWPCSAHTRTAWHVAEQTSTAQPFCKFGCWNQP